MSLKEEFVKFFIEKNHTILPPASLVPENNTTLFTSAGIQQLVPYMVQSEIHPLGGRLVNYQKCLRLTDIENIGDSYHHTFFEMLGNWSMNDYFKKEVIEMSYEFLTQRLHLDPKRLAVSVFAGDEVLPKDEEAAEIWNSLGIPRERIAYLGTDDNWWPSVNEKGPCGSDTEMFYWRSNDPVPAHFDPEDERWVEIWNNVFIQYNRDEEMNLIKFDKRYIDTGMGVERVTAIINDLTDNYETELFKPIISVVEQYSQKSYQEDENKKDMRIIADHIRAVTMIMSDDKNLFPSNKDRGYILRRLIRRIIISANNLGIQNTDALLRDLIASVMGQLGPSYPYIVEEQPRITEIVNAENIRFQRVLKDGEKRTKKAIEVVRDRNLDYMDSSIVFKLYETYGIPFDLTYAVLDKEGIKYNRLEVEALFEQHRILSRQSSKERFGEGIGETGNGIAMVKKQ